MLAERVVLALGLLCWMHPVRACPEPTAYYEGQVEPRCGENFGFAQYRCWLPTFPRATKGVLCVVLHPHGNAGVTFADSGPWIELAARYQCALLGLSFVDSADKTKNWSHAFDGSGRALVAALDEVAVASGIKELARSRIVIAGICEAGQFAYGFSAYAPERVAAFMTMGGSLHQLHLAWRAATIPGLLVAASDRGHSAFDNMFSLFTEGREYFAPWLFALEKIQDYDQGTSSALVGDFLCNALARLQEPAPPFASSFGPIMDPHTIKASVARVTRSNTRAAASIYGFLDCDIAGLLYPWEATTAYHLSDVAPPSSALSFVSIPLPSLGYIGTKRIDLGTIHLTAGAQQQSAATFMVYSDARSAVDGIEVISDLASLSWQSARLGTREWQIHCNLDLSALPSGTFVVPVPVRFLSEGKVKPGGLTTLVTGKIARDVFPEPSSINFDKINVINRHARLKLKSVSGASIQVLGIESSLPDGVKAKVDLVSDGSVEVSCWFDSSRILPGPFSGYYLLKVKSDCEQILKIMFYGRNSKEDEKPSS